VFGGKSVIDSHIACGIVLVEDLQEFATHRTHDNSVLSLAHNRAPLHYISIYA